MIERLARRALEPTNNAWLAAFRVLFGLTMLASLLRFIAYGWIDDFFVKPSFHFKYWGFSWIEPLSAGGMHALFWVLGGLALAVTVGFCFRVAAIGFAVGFGYLQLADATTYLNHYYLAFLLAVLLAASPAHRRWSLDALMVPKLRSATSAVAWLWVLRFQVGVVYTFAGLAKANQDWLIHAQPLGIWLASRTGIPFLGELFAEAWTAPAMSWMGFLFDTSIAWFLLLGRTRPVAFGAVIVFHTLTRLLFPIGMFPFIMVLSALVFFPPSWPVTLLARFLPQVASQPQLPVSSSRSPWARPALGLLAVWCAIQVVLPLRHLAYGGNVLWHEQGMRWSWRVMVREKNGSVTFLVRNTDSGRIWHVSPSAYLNRVQEREMSSQPDLILQLAHHVRADFERRGLGPVEVRADAVVSLNGRRTARLIDPDVDLGKVTDSLGRASWILDAPTGPPPHIRPVPSQRLSER